MSCLEKFVTYEQFGANGDGKTDDMPAIVACHDYANEHGLEVYAKDDATYYIGGKDISAKIMTSTHFGKAKFIIDDIELENRRTWCFIASSAYEKFDIDIRSLEKNQKHIDFPHEGKVYVRVTNSNRRMFIRKGNNANSGADCSDTFVVDESGNILHGINWNYDTVTSAYAFRVDDEPIVIEGGIFTTVANQHKCEKYDSYARGFYVARSNVTFRNITHYIEGEGEFGAPYSGFIAAGECYNTLIENCVFTPHKTYKMPSKIPGALVNMGTYELGFTASLSLTLRGITQTRDILDSTYWGLMGSNYSKNFVIEDCVISRFDAHCGVTNSVIRNCTFGHAGFNLIGFGEMLIENVTIIRHESFINLRADYGCFFDGKVIIRNCTWKPSGEKYRVFTAYNVGDHDFGYKCMMPEIIIDGLYIDDSGCTDTRNDVVLFANYDPDFKEGKPFPYYSCEKLTANGVKTKSGRPVIVCEDEKLYPHVKNVKIN